MFRCQCKCGNIGEVQLSCLRNGHSTSCGCEQKKKPLLLTLSMV